MVLVVTTAARNSNATRVVVYCPRLLLAPSYMKELGYCRRIDIVLDDTAAAKQTGDENVLYSRLEERNQYRQPVIAVVE